MTHARYAALASKMELEALAIPVHQHGEHRGEPIDSALRAITSRRYRRVLNAIMRCARQAYAVQATR